jgi:serine/threonine-protein kinase
LTHPGIVPVFDIGFRDDGKPFYTMQFVRGRTLAQVLRSSGSLAERLRYLNHFHELCQAVAFAHSRGVVHRDIKPHNVVIGEFGQAMLIDWGLAKQTHAAREEPLEPGEVPDAPDATVAGSVVGTPAYMSPEQAAGRLEDVDERSDVFGLGAVLYEILTGRAPHEGRKVTELLAAARTVSAAPVGPEAPRELAVIAHKALALDRAERYERAAEMAGRAGLPHRRARGRL